MNKVASKFSIGLENAIMQIRRLYLNTPATLCRKYNLDYSKVPVLDEKDIKEQFVHGWGPGGQAVNKTLNCVVLVHQSLGITVKCHQTRSLEQNRRRARELMVQKMDNLLNGEDSLENQKKKIDEQKQRTNEAKSRKRAILKEEWKRQEELDKVKDA